MRRKCIAMTREQFTQVLTTTDALEELDEGAMLLDISYTGEQDCFFLTFFCPNEKEFRPFQTVPVNVAHHTV